MGTRVLITGGAGYLGSVMTGHLLKKGYEITWLDSLIYGQKTAANFSQNTNFDFVFGDVRDKNMVRIAIKGQDIIIPLAALVGEPICKRKPEEAKSINYEAIKMLNKLRGREQALIYPTTNSGYGTKTGESFCTEETPLDPISLYGITKTDAERLLLDSKKDAVTLRLATVFGVSPRMRTDLLVNDWVLRAMNEKEIEIYEPGFRRNFVHIKDIARCFEHCIENFDKMAGEPYNVGLDSANMSKRDLAERIKQHIPEFKISYGSGEDPDKRDYIVSNKKIHKTGFYPRFSLDFGIEELIEEYGRLLQTGSGATIKETGATLRKPPYRNV